jgi:hypothetical protein
VPAAGAPRTLRLEAGASFALPAPDGRVRSYRLLSLELTPEPAASAL